MDGKKKYGSCAFERLMSFLAEFIFADDAIGEWKRRTEEEREELCKAATDYGLGPLFYYALLDVLPPEHKEKFGEENRLNGVRALRFSYQYDLICALFRRNMIRFVPLKGAVLAREVYPAPSLRPMCDLDILVHPSDCSRALELLREEGWEGGEFRGEHHFSCLRKQTVVLEIHYDLPGFHTENPDTLWGEFLPENTSGEYRLSAELNLLLLISHATNHHWHNGIRMLLDLAFVIRQGQIDWEQVELLAKRFGLISPCSVCSLVPELFAGQVPDKVKDTELLQQTATDFKLLLQENLQFTPNTWEAVMNDPARYSAEWWLKRLRGIRPQVVSRRHGLKPGQYGKLLIYFCRDLRQKIVYGLRMLYRSENRALHLHLERQNRINALLEYLSGRGEYDN